MLVHLYRKRLLSFCNSFSYFENPSSGLSKFETVIQAYINFFNLEKIDKVEIDNVIYTKLSAAKTSKIKG